MKYLYILVSLLLLSTQSYAQDPYRKADDSWITINGKVDSVSADYFLLDYGDGTITVEMDDSDRDSEGYNLVKGDNVTVYGMIDDDFYEQAKIEASSVYVKNIGTTFYASSVDEEDNFASYLDPDGDIDTILNGTVTSIDGDKFILDTGNRKLEVDTSDMGYNPLDDEGYQRIEEGDRVSVTGNIESNWFSDRVMEAESVITLRSSDEG